jgi:hypothetical protein
MISNVLDMVARQGNLRESEQCHQRKEHLLQRGTTCEARHLRLSEGSMHCQPGFPTLSGSQATAGIAMLYSNGNSRQANRIEHPQTI